MTNLEKSALYLEQLEEICTKKREEIINTPTTLSVVGQKYYVSNSGDDSLDGKTPETAWKTAAKVNSYCFAKGDGVFFRRGDLFRERLLAKEGVTYSAYGKGEKPKFYGSPEDGAKASEWFLMDGTENIWIYNKKLSDVGTLVLDEGKQVAVKRIPDWYNERYYVRDSKGTELWDVKKGLDHDLEIFCEINSSDFSTPGTLYFRCDKGNPGDVFYSIEFNVGGIIELCGDGITIDNLCLRYCGGHAIAGPGPKCNIKVTNCEIGWIGGATLRAWPNDYGKISRFGNGVEVYGAVDGYEIDNCYIYQCYDAGVTHQFNGKGCDIPVSMSNIRYSDNLIEDCNYAIEYFLNSGKDETVLRGGRNFEITGNILRRSGYGWGSQRINGNCGCNIMGWVEAKNEYDKGTFTVRDNILDRSFWKLFSTAAGKPEWCAEYSGNTYIQHLGIGCGINRTELPDFSENTEKEIRDILGDKEARVYILPTAQKE